MPYRTDDALACPHCDDAVLSAQTVQWIERHACSSCSGVWFNREALAELAQDLDIKASLPFAPPDDTPSTRRCPHCRETMHTETTSEGDATVVIDACSLHGLWFDHNELEPMLELIMAREDVLRSPFERTNRPWWAATLSFVLAVLGNAPKARLTR